jgi:hypothetical protein
MKVDVSMLLVRLAERAKVHQEQLQRCLKIGHEQMGRALGKSDPYRGAPDDETESVDWALKAQVHRARLDETQRTIEIITATVATAAQAGRIEA